MKFFKTNIFYLLLFTAALFAGCNNGAQKKKVIGLSMDTYTEERWAKDAAMFKKEAERLGLDVEIQACNGDENLQNKHIENFVTKQVDAIVIVPHNSKTCATAIKQAKEAGIPVIAYDRLINDADLDLYISFDNQKVGEMQAQYILNIAPEGNYILAEGSSTDNNALLYHQGHLNVLKQAIDAGKIKIIMDQYCKDWLPAEALKQTQNALTLCNNNVAAIVAANDGLASGCIQALSEQQLQGKVPVSGQDAEVSAIQRIIDGTQTMTVYKPIKLLATQAAQATAMLINKQPLQGVNAKLNNNFKEVPSILLAPIAVDKANYMSTVVADEFIDKGKLKIQ
ncbi:MAG: substrate-binding domain-containing protein [Bacteroidetes bacterium]|nr:substrate-binding domain-containing protein [Bacteroidota bacterium]